MALKSINTTFDNGLVSCFHYKSFISYSMLTGLLGEVL
jgi:hypothetical protein